MRTTVDLAPDVLAAVEDLRQRRGIGLSEAVNEIARMGLRVPEPRVRFWQRAYAMGGKVQVDDVGGTLDLFSEY